MGGFRYILIIKYKDVQERLTENVHIHTNNNHGYLYKIL